MARPPPDVRIILKRGDTVGRKARKLPGSDIYYGRVEHPAVDRWARKVAMVALGVALVSAGFAVTILGWVTWATA